MKLTLRIIRLIFFCHSLFINFLSAQQRVDLHPLIGDSISYKEAYKYYLFRDLGKLQFEYALVQLNNGEHSVKFIGDSVYCFTLDSTQLKVYSQNVELINQYELASNEKGRAISIDDSIMAKPVNLYLMSDEKKKKMIKDARLYHWKKLNADEQGLHGTKREDYMNYSGAFFWEPVKKK